jgi:hypothetical protein
MKVSIIVSDKTVVIDGEGYTDMVSQSCWNDVPANIHAYQYNSENSSQSEIEHNDGTPHSPCTLSDIQKFIDAHAAEKQNILDRETAWINSWARVKADRDQYLRDSDWTQVEDSPLTAEKISEYTTYRQLLRDLPATYSAEQPKNITFYEGDVMLTASDGSKSIIVSKPVV